MKSTVWRIVLGLVAGIVIGLLINHLWTDQTWPALGINTPEAFLAHREAPDNQPTTSAQIVRTLVDINAFIGQLFIRLLRFAAVPLVLFSIISGVASVGAAEGGGLGALRRLGLRTLLIYSFTAVSSVIIGLIISRAVQPGSFIDAAHRQSLISDRAADAASLAERTGQMKSLSDQLLAMVPTNPFDALARGDMLQIILFALVIGAGLALVGRDRSGPIIGACELLADIMGRFVRAVMFVAPLAVFCLLVPAIAGLGLGVLKAMGVYCLCVIGGLFLVIALVYSPMVALLARMSPIRFLHALGPAQLVAFSSSSSNATLPVTMQCVTERLGVPKPIAGFVCPLGATVNMDGTSVYLGVAVAFIAQAMGVELTLAQQLMLVITITLSAVGSPGIPGGSLVFLVAMLQNLGIPAEGIALILSVDRILDMARTVVNVIGDAVASVIVARFEPAGLMPIAT